MGHYNQQVVVMVSGSVTTAEGSSLVKLGHMTVICGIKAVSVFQIIS